jgi:hypothetical protein
MERGPTQVDLVIRERTLHQRDQRRDDRGPGSEQWAPYGLRQSPFIATEMPEELLRRGRPRGPGVSRMVGMVHNVLLCSVRREQLGTVVGTRFGQLMDIAGLSQQASEHTP